MTRAATLLALVLATQIFACVQALRCWSCNGARSQADCTAHGHIQPCASNQESCESEIRRNNGQYQISRMCKQRQACENNKKNNVKECKGKESVKKNPVCRYCCMTDMCNKNAGIDPVPKSNRCKRIPPPKFGRKNCNFNGFPPEGKIGSKCKFTCNNGYVLKGKMMSFCKNRSPALPPAYNNQVRSCKKAPTPTTRCTTLPTKPENGDLQCPGMGHVNTTCEFLCNSGFVISGSDTTTCILKNGKAVWESETPKCNPVRTPKSACNNMPTDPAFRGLNCDGNSKRGFTSCQLFCKVGLVLNGPSIIKCISQDGRAVWNSQPPYCVSPVVGCGEFPPTPDNGQRLCDGNGEIGNKCEYSCDPGFELFGEPSTECVVINGKTIWEPAVPKCVIIKRDLCKVPLDKNVEDWSCHSDPGGKTICEFSCKTRFVAVRETTIHCDYIDGREVWEANPPYCAAESACNMMPMDPTFRGLNCDGNSKKGFTSCQLSCKVGLVLVGPSIIKCISRDGRAVWNTQPPYCVSPAALSTTTTTSPTTTIPATTTTTTTSTTTASTTTPATTTNTTTPATTTTTTTPATTTSRTTPTTTTTTTTPATTTTMATPATTTTTTTSTTTASTTTPATTTTTTMPATTTTTATPATITTTTMPATTTITTTPATTATKAPRLTCLKCVNKTSLPSCLRDGVQEECAPGEECWTNIQFFDGKMTVSKGCKEISECEAETRANKPICNPTKGDSNCTCCCDISRCNRRHFFCHAQCPASPKAPANGRVECSGTGGVGTTCEFSCHPGYKMSDSSTSTCTTQDNTAVWETPAPSCERTSGATPLCYLPDFIPYTRLNCNGDDSNGYTSCNIACLPGYGSRLSTIHCVKRDGREVWDFDSPRCELMSIGCGKSPPTLDNGQAVCDGDGGVGTKCEYSCDPGLEIFGESVTECVLENGEAVWKSAIPECKTTKGQIQRCPILEPPMNGSKECVPGDSDEGIVGTKCTFKCDPNFEMEGPASISCVQWESGQQPIYVDDDPPTCRPLPEPTPTESERLSNCSCSIFTPPSLKAPWYCCRPCLSVCPSVRPSVRPSVCLSVCPSVRTCSAKTNGPKLTKIDMKSCFGQWVVAFFSRKNKRHRAALGTALADSYTDSEGAAKMTLCSAACVPNVFLQRQLKLQ